MNMFAHYFIPQSLQSFMTLALGWSLSSKRHTITAYLQISGAVSHKHFSRYYAFLSGRFFNVAEKLWATLILAVIDLIPADQFIRIKIDSTTRKKSGSKIHGRDNYRNGAGTARQEYRTLLGLHFLYAVISVPLTLGGSTHYLNVPIGLKLYLKQHWAKKLNRPFRSKSELARQIIDQAATLAPWRRFRVCADGDFATKAFLRDLPPSVNVVCRFPINSPFYEPPDLASHKGRGRRPLKGKRIGTPLSLSKKKDGWQPHPDEKDVHIQLFQGIWHSVLPKKEIQIVVVKRDNVRKSKRNQLEAFFTTDLTLTAKTILHEYRRRWDIEIDIRDANAFYGLGQDQCRKYRRIVAINNFRMLMAASRTLFCIQQLQKAGQLNLIRFRPWYRQKRQLSQLDIRTISQELLQTQGIFPISCFIQDMAEIKHNNYGPRPRAA
jgi:hypothetical protein